MNSTEECVSKVAVLRVSSFSTMQNAISTFGDSFNLISKPTTPTVQLGLNPSFCSKGSTTWSCCVSSTHRQLQPFWVLSWFRNLGIRGMRVWSLNASQIASFGCVFRDTELVHIWDLFRNPHHCTPGVRQKFQWSSFLLSLKLPRVVFLWVFLGSWWIVRRKKKKKRRQNSLKWWVVK